MKDKENYMYHYKHSAYPAKGHGTPPILHPTHTPHLPPSSTPSPTVYCTTDDETVKDEIFPEFESSKRILYERFLVKKKSTSQGGVQLISKLCILWRTDFFGSDESFFASILSVASEDSFSPATPLSFRSIECFPDASPSSILESPWLAGTGLPVFKTF